MRSVLIEALSFAVFLFCFVGIMGFGYLLSWEACFPTNFQAVFLVLHFACLKGSCVYGARVVEPGSSQSWSGWPTWVGTTPRGAPSKSAAAHSLLNQI